MTHANPAAHAPPAPPRALVAVLVAAAGLGTGLAALCAAGLLLGSPPPPPPNPFGVGVAEGAASAGGLGGWLLAAQATFHARILSALGASDGESWALAGLSFAYGVFHAAGPGHGKAVVSGYILATGADLRRGTAAATAAAFLQAVVALALVLGLSAALGLGAIGFRAATGYVETASFALVALVGGWLLARKSIDLAGRIAPAPHACGPSCGHLHSPPPAGAGARAFAGTVVAAGSRPCSGAILVLVYALSRGMPWTGVGAVLAMAAGTAAATAGLAALAVHAKGLALRFAAGRGAGASLALGFAEVCACALVALLGAAVLLGLSGAGNG